MMDVNDVENTRNTDNAPAGAVASGAATEAATTAEAGATAEAATIAPVAGLGVDIIEIERMERALRRTPRIRERIFSEGERAYAQEKARPAVHYALFFAAKEAVFKALGTGFAGMGFTDVEVDHDRFGRPVPILHGRAKELAKELDVVELQLSLSYTHTVGVASAVAIKEADRPKKDEKIDPRAELARQFKEVRALLDDMDERIKALDEDEGVTKDMTEGTVPFVKSTDLIKGTVPSVISFVTSDDAEHTDD
ncbi:MAG: holo-ACP synthase [Coriobacteriia bacterium]|nr:holo-ACP synthase [Coriobacteriia bacterium]